MELLSGILGCLWVSDDDFIDFGKFFRRKQKEQPEQAQSGSPYSSEPQREHFGKEHDEEITLGKIKSFFKREETDKSETIEFDWQQHTKWLIPLVIIVGVFIFAFYIRAQTVNLPATDAWAENSVYSFYRNQIEQQINQQFPNLPAENKNTLIERDFQNILVENKDMILQQVEATSQQFKEHFRDSTGQTYLLGIDPYYYYRQSRNILQYGTVGTEIRDGQPFDSYKPAPEGQFIESNLHPYVGVVVYKVMNFFTGISHMGAFFYVGAIIAALSVIPAFFIARRVGGNVGGFFASMFVAVNLFFVSRTAGESSDTDAYNVFIPLLISWIFIESVYQKDLKKKLGLMALTGFLVGVYAFTWTGWWFILYFLFATLAGQLFFSFVYESLHQKKITLWTDEIKQQVYSIITFFVSSVLFVSIFVGIKQVTRLLARPSQFVGLKDVATSKIWPNVLTTVAELNPSSFDSVVGQLGGYFLLTMAIVGILLMLREGMRDDEKHWLQTTSLILLGIGIGLLLWYSWASRPFYVLLLAFVVFSGAAVGLYRTIKKMHALPHFNLTYFLLFGMWLGITLWSTKNGVRFTLLIVPPLIMGAGFFCGKVYTNLAAWASSGLGISKNVTHTIIFILLLILLVFPQNHIRAGYNQGVNSVPSMNDGWYDALLKINEESQPNAIITSWWDFGHWFKAVADRPVTFDGGSQNRPQAHWVGKLLLTPDEKVSFGILRMLDCGANKAFEEVDSVFHDIPQSVDVINKIIIKDRNGASDVLRKEGFTSEKIEHVLQYTHCTPPEGFVIASDDMVGKGGVWGHFGAWDFNRAEMVFKTRQLDRTSALGILQSDFNLSPGDAEKMHAEIISEDPNGWIAPWPGYIGGFNGCALDNTTLSCPMSTQSGSFPLLVDLNTMDATIPTKDGTLYPDTLVYVEDGKVQRKAFSQPTIGFSVMLIPSGDGFVALLAAPLQAGSIFSQLFFYEGVGLRCFEPFDSRQQITGGKIYAYKVDWECEL